MTLLYEAHRMNTIEPFNLGGIIDDAINGAGGVIDDAKDGAGDILDDAKGGIGGIIDDVADFGKNIGGKIVDFGKGIGKFFGGAFKKLIELWMWLLKNWKIGLAVIVGLFILYWVSRISGFIKMFTGK